MATRWLALACLTVVVLGSLGASGVYAWYLHSDLYRRFCEAALAESLGLPADIGRVVPVSRTARDFLDVKVWLPERRGRALACERATVLRTPQPDDPDAYEIELRGGACEVSTRTWLREDYRAVVQSGLKPGFAPGGPERVRFARMALSFERGDFRAELTETAGQVVFENPSLARAYLLSRTFNGYRTPEPVYLEAQFSPQARGLRVERLELTAPRLPLAVAGLEALVGVHVSSGAFSGRLAYGEDEDGVARVTLSGRCVDLELGDFTEGLVGQRIGGRCPEIELGELLVEGGLPERVRFGGALADVSLADVLRVLGVDAPGGTANLRIGEARLSREGAERLVATGACEDLSLEALSTAIGRGRMSGVARVVIHDLTIENNRLRSLDAVVQVRDALDRPNWVETKLLLSLTEDVLHLSIPRALANRLPERVEYTRFGFRVQVRDEVMQVFGTHGDDERTILTVLVLGRETALIREPPRAIDLAPMLDDLRQRAWEAVSSIEPQ